MATSLGNAFPVHGLKQAMHAYLRGVRKRRGLIGDGDDDSGEEQGEDD